MRKDLSGMSLIHASMIRKSSSSSSTINIRVGRLEGSMLSDVLLVCCLSANFVIFSIRCFFALPGDRCRLWRSRQRQGYDKCGSLARFAQGRDIAFMHFYDLFAERQTDARPFVFGAGVQAAEHVE